MIEKLQEKIRNQANRLCEFQNYKTLCESRIKQLSPSHPLPILESHLRLNKDLNESTTLNNSKTLDNNQLQAHKQKNEELVYALEIKERVRLFIFNYRKLKP